MSATFRYTAIVSATMAVRTTSATTGWISAAPSTTGTGVARTTATSTARKTTSTTPIIRYVAPIVLVRIRIPLSSIAAVDRKNHDEAATPPALRRAARVASVPPRDLPHQREPQPRAGDFLGSRAAVE